MAERSSGDGGGFPAILNGALVALTLAGGLWLVSSQLESARPAARPGTPAPAIGDQAVEARLWEDPLPPIKDGDAALSIDALAEAIRHAKESGKVVLLPVMIAGGPYSEDRESRIRSRFAVVSALGRRGYVPNDAEHLGAVKVCWPTSRELAKWKQRADAELQIPLGSCRAGPEIALSVRYEWYRPRVFAPDSEHLAQGGVLVLWLNDDAFDDEPLLRLSLLLGGLVRAAGADSSDPVVRLIGPQRSSTLRAMLPEEFRGASGPHQDQTNPALWGKVRDVLRNVALYSATASAMDEVLVKEPGAPDSAPRQIVTKRLTDKGLKEAHFLNANDVQTANEILDELRLRDVDLRKRDDHLVLLYEWDTFYGRMLSLTYGALMESQPDAKGRAQLVDDYRHGRRPLPPNLHAFSYLRGLDGRTVGDSEAAGKNKAGQNGGEHPKPGSFAEVLQWRPGENKAEGPGQFDYLFRIGDRLESLQRELRRNDRGTIKAIGIVGSDVYDVLVILQALRRRFPEVLFFTTDLDARLFDPDERSWARNLIVASSYGLQLNDDLQEEVPPFRDSAQTAQFAAALAALGDERLAHLTFVPPRRFEIGNGTAVDLSLPERRSDRAFNDAHYASRWLHPSTRTRTSSNDRRTGVKLSLALPLLALAMAAYYYWNPFRRRSTRETGYLTAPLQFSDPDVGGPTGADAILLTIFLLDDPLCAWLKAQLLSADGELFPPSWLGTARGSTVPPGAAAGIANQRADEPLRDERADALVALLNRILGHETVIPATVLQGSSLVDPIRVTIGRMSVGAVPWFEGLQRAQQRFLAREFLDHLLERLGEASATISRSNPTRELAVARDARRAAMKIFSGRVWFVLFSVVLAAAFGFVLWRMGLGIWDDTFVRANGEPFSLTNGTSAWPNLTLRLITPVLALLLIALLFKQLRALFFSLSRSYRLPFSAWEPVSPEHVCAARLWQEFFKGGSIPMRMVRASLPFVLYLAFGYVLLRLFGFPVPPVRGETTRWWAETLRHPFYVVFLILSFLTIDAALRCRRFIRALGAAPTEYPQTTLDYFKRQRGDVGVQYLDEWIDTQLIADLTEGVGALLWFPGIIFLLMLAALNQWTDHWTASTGLVVILALNFAISIASVLILQRAALTAKDRAEKSLYAKVKKAQAAIAPSPASNDATQAEKLLDEIRNLSRGAYRGFWENPVVGAVLLPSGGTALLQLAVWLANR